MVTCVVCGTSAPTPYFLTVMRSDGMMDLAGDVCGKCAAKGLLFMADDPEDGTVPAAETPEDGSDSSSEEGGDEPAVVMWPIAMPEDFLAEQLAAEAAPNPEDLLSFVRSMGLELASL